MLSRQLLLPFAMTLLALTHSACDALLGLYGTTPLPHRGRDRLVTFLSKRARNRWNSVRLMRRRGLVMESDLSVDDVGWTLYAYGCLDYWDERVIRGMLTPGCFCLDIGAHIGYYSLLFSRLAGHTGRVFSYEPVPYTYSFLERNLQRNGASNVRAQQAAAGSRNGVVRMAFPNGGRLGWCTVSDSGDVQVRCTMIDSEISRLALDRVDFVKIDTEGYELQVLAGAERMIRQMRPKVMFEINRKALERHDVRPAEVRDFFLSHNYGLFVAGRRGLSTIANLSQGPSYFNVFALPNLNAMALGKSVVEERSGEGS